MSSAAAGVFDRGNGEGRPAAGGDAEDDIVPHGFALFDFFDGKFGVVFARLGGCSKGSRAPGHDVLHGARAGVEGRRNFRSVKCTKSSAGAGSNIDEASAASEPVGDDINCTGNLRQSITHSSRDCRVFVERICSVVSCLRSDCAGLVEIKCDAPFESMMPNAIF